MNDKLLSLPYISMVYLTYPVIFVCCPFICYRTLSNPITVSVFLILPSLTYFTFYVALSYIITNVRIFSLSFLTVSYHIIPCLTFNYPVLPLLTLSYLYLPCLTLTYAVLPFLTFSNVYLPCLTFNYPVLPLITLSNL